MVIYGPDKLSVHHRIKMEQHGTTVHFNFMSIPLIIRGRRVAALPPPPLTLSLNKTKFIKRKKKDKRNSQHVLCIKVGSSLLPTLCEGEKTHYQ